MAQNSDNPKFPAPIPNPAGQPITQEEEVTDPGIEVPLQFEQEEPTPVDLARPSRSFSQAQSQAQAQSQSPAPSFSPASTPPVPPNTTRTGNPQRTVPRTVPRTVKMPEMGPLDIFMKDPAVSEIMVNDLRNVMIEKDGKLQFSGFAYQSIDELNRLTRNILDITGRIVSPDAPYVDTMLPDGSRVNIVVPPLTIYGPCITIRKFPAKQLSIHDLMKLKALDQRMAYFLNCCVIARLNILICGGTGGGKTTLLNVLSTFIPKAERIITIEDTPELALQHFNSVRLQTKPQTPASAAVTARDLVANALRMRPDRIIVGECRRSEAFDMLQAMNTGHQGSMTTLHANSPRDGLARLETLCMLAGVDLPLSAIRKQMASAIDLIIQIHRFRDGTRRVTYISEVTGMEADTITLQDLFLYENDRFKTNGLVPICIERLRENGIELPNNYFG